MFRHSLALRAGLHLLLVLTGVAVHPAATGLRLSEREKPQRIISTAALAPLLASIVLLWLLWLLILLIV